MAGNFDTHLRMHFEVFPHVCMYREAMLLQCFLPTHYVRGVARLRAQSNVTTFTHFGQVSAACLHCMVPLCTQLDYMVVFGQFFFCLVFWLP